MFSTLFVAASQFFTMFTTLFSAGDKACKALEHLATWSEETANQFNETARIERGNELHKLRHQAALEQHAREAEATVALTPAPQGKPNGKAAPAQVTQ
jgi:hypothetical protein